MKRKITALCACLALALCLLPLFAQRAEAADLDYIASYDISVTPNTDDGSLDIRVQIEWQVLDEGPVEWVKIGLPNGSIRNETALTANIDRLSYDNSYMYVYFVRGSPTPGRRSTCITSMAAPSPMTTRPAGSTRRASGR